MIEQIRQILNQGEGTTIEFKTSQNELNKNTFESICAFLNRKGGHLLLGVTDEGMVEGIEDAKVQYLIDRLVSSMINPHKFHQRFILFPKL